MFRMAISVREKIYQTIRDEITFGQLLPSERLIEKDLVKRYSASRNTIRECLRQLQSEGLLEFTANKGVRISKLSTKQVDEIYTLRMLLESFATRLSAQKATPEQVAYLENLQHGCIKAVVDPDFRAWIKNNTAFHNFFYENCGNDNLKPILDSLKRRVYRYQYIIISIPGNWDKFLLSHEKILQAFRDNDGRAAEKHMRYHLNHNRKLLLDHLKEFPGLYPA